VWKPVHDHVSSTSGLCGKHSSDFRYIRRFYSCSCRSPEQWHRNCNTSNLLCDRLKRQRIHTCELEWSVISAEQRYDNNIQHRFELFPVYSPWFSIRFHERKSIHNSSRNGTRQHLHVRGNPVLGSPLLNRPSDWTREHCSLSENWQLMGQVRIHWLLLGIDSSEAKSDHLMLVSLSSVLVGGRILRDDRRSS
jgi:hypothetical protein